MIVMPAPEPSATPPTPPTTASAWIEQWSHLVEQGGAVLDVASGNGRHARHFALRGHPVLALDRDEIALANLAAVQHVTTRCADLENASWPLQDDEKFAAVVVTNYLHRPLFPYLFDALAPGGVLLYETFAAGNERFGKPSIRTSCSIPASCSTPCGGGYGSSLIRMVLSTCRAHPAYSASSLPHHRGPLQQRSEEH